MKRIIALLMAAMLLLTAGAAWAEDFETEEDEEEEAYLYTGPAYDPKELVVGNPTPLSGNFTTRMWGYSTSDVDVMALINGYNLIRWDHGYDYFEPDPSVVTSMSVMDQSAAEGGNRVYVLTLNEALKYSDGTPITAADYAFSILLSTAPAVRTLGGDTNHYTMILGVDDYRTGNRNGITGVRILNHYTLSLTVKKEYLPFFYELSYLRCYPMPIRAIAPGCQVLDDGEGAYIDGVFNSVLLETTLLDPKYGYLSHPSVVSGPYKLYSYDDETHEAVLDINTMYIGNFEGQKPSIHRLRIRPANGSDVIERLEAGEFGLLNKVLKEETIQEGVSLAGMQNYAMQSYSRSGLSFLSLCCELGAMKYQTVRQALALCLDKDETVSRYCGSYGIRTDGYYGIGQWMYQAASGSLAIPELEEAGDALSMTNIKRYDLDVEEAVHLLETDGWTLNSDGDPYDPEWDDYRCRMNEEGKIERLDFTLEYPVGNGIGDILKDTFIAHLTEAGIRVTLVPVDWQNLLREYYRLDRRTAHILYLGSNFQEVFDPRAQFDPSTARIGLGNNTGIADDELYRLACDMAATNPGDLLTYENHWMAFQQRYQELVPAIPVYSNAYFDFYTRWLQNYDVTGHVTWTDAILYAYMSEPTVPDEGI